MAKSLYKIAATGAEMVWTISGNVGTATVTIQFGYVGGAMQEQTDKITINQSGRGMKEQMILEIKSRITKQRAKGYRNTIEEAKKHLNQNSLDLLKPMLAVRHDRTSAFDHASAYRQFKYDGHRMLVHNNGERLIAYTRNGKLIDTLDHILEGLVIPEGATIDGEVYYHGEKLQTIASWCKREQPNTKKLFYQVYDVIRPVEYGERFEELNNMELGEKAFVVPTWKNDKPIVEDLHMAIEAGYEGLIIRPSGSYMPGKRCRSLIKVKDIMDDEFLVLDVEESRDGWGILVCQTAMGKTFKVSAPGSIPEKTRILRDRLLFIGQTVRVEFYSLTNDQIPFHPVATGFRDKLGE